MLCGFFVDLNVEIIQDTSSVSVGVKKRLFSDGSFRNVEKLILLVGLLTEEKKLVKKICYFLGMDYISLIILFPLTKS